MTRPIQQWEQGKVDIEQLNAALGRYCLSLTKCQWAADDLRQTTWIKFLESAKLQQHNNVEALLLRTAKNKWIDLVRREIVLERILYSFKEQFEVSDHDSSLKKLNLELAFQLLIKHLTPIQRAVMLMRSVFGYSSAETAQKLLTTEGAVKTAFHRARNNLKKLNLNSSEFGFELMELDDTLEDELKELAEAYVNGEVDEVIRLIQLDRENVSAIGVYTNNNQTISGYSPSLYYSNQSFGARMSA